MNEEPEILRIEIPMEEEEVAATGPSVTERVKGAAAGTANKAWQSDARKQVTGTAKKGAQKGVSVVAAKTAELMQEHVVKAAEEQAKKQAAQMETRIRETDWKAEGQKGAAAAARWASEQAKKAAARLQKEPPAATDKPDGEPSDS
jgi:hypothetical protein